MPISNWVALLSIAHRFKFTDAESRTQREVFQHSPPLDPVKQIFLAEKHSVPISFVVPVLEDFVRRAQPLQKKELTNLSLRDDCAVCKVRETYSRASLVLADVCLRAEPWFKQVARNIVKSVWHDVGCHVRRDAVDRHVAVPFVRRSFQTVYGISVHGMNQRSFASVYDIRSRPVCITATSRAIFDTRNHTIGTALHRYEESRISSHISRYMAPCPRTTWQLSFCFWLLNQRVN